MDKISKERRSDNMRRIRSGNTKPEMEVRRLVYGMGYRYRLHRKELPGKPDLVFAGRRKAIFVHGCFWHQHPDSRCVDARLPKSNKDYWLPKLRRNQKRDKEAQKALTERGWDWAVIWECETKDREWLARRVTSFLESG